MLASLLLRGAVFGAVGLALGAAHFTGLRLNTRLYLARGSGRTCALGLHALRMVSIVAAWLVVALFGGVALVAAFAGLIAARQMMAWQALRSS